MFRTGFLLPITAVSAVWAAPEDFEPILKANCAACHSAPQAYRCHTDNSSRPIQPQLVAAIHPQ